MILTSSAKGPSYSTDSTAHAISRFVATHDTLTTATPRPSVTDVPGALEDLYPSLFAEPQRSGFMLALETFGATFASIFGGLHARANRNGDRASRVASAIAERYASKV